MEDYSDVVLTTRIRLARNVKGYKFPYNMIDKERKALLNEVKDKLKDKCTILELDNIDDVTKKSLVEKHEISKELLQNSSTAIITDDSKHVVTMVNEEDHFRIQAFANGFDIDKAYENMPFIILREDNDEKTKN
jgi:protein arginine kinase